MSAEYLLRFDDICPTMNWGSWERIEVILKKLRVKPILAVVPDNCDPQLVVGEPRPDFWERVRQWQAWGWTIGLHGYQHLYETREAGLIGLNARSEFAGLSFEQQETRILAGLKIFRREGVEPSIWVAPGHSFDEMTVKVLQKYGLTEISDGFFCHPVRYLNSVWIPQQLWRFHAFPFGLWTICYHHNMFSEKGLSRIDKDIHHYSSQLVSLDQIVASPYVRNIGLLDRLAAAAWLQAIRFKLKVQQ